MQLLNKSKFLGVGTVALAVLSGAALFAPSASSFTVGLPPGSVTIGNFTFSEISTTSTNAAWLAYTLNPSLNPLPDRASFSIQNGSVTVQKGSYNISYKITSTHPITEIILKQDADVTSTTKNVSLTQGGPNVAGFPLNVTSPNAVVMAGVSGSTSFYVMDTIEVGDNGFVNSVTNTFVAVPEPLTMLGAMTAVGFGVGFKRKLAKVSKSDSKEA